MSILENNRQYLRRAAVIIVCSLLVLLPYHAFLSVWVGSSFGAYRYVQLWKEGLIALLFCLVLITCSWQDLRKYIRDNRFLFGIIISYGLLTTTFGVIAYASNTVDFRSLAFAMIINLRFLVFFLAVHLLFSQYKVTPNWVTLVVVPAIPVVVFGLIQQYFLPPRFLEYFGYSMYTILPFQYIDNNPEYLRVQSVLRGANPFGAYLVLVLSVMLYWLASARTPRLRLVGLACLFLSLGALYFTYSRSAWAGALVSSVILGVVFVRKSSYAHKRALLAVSFFLAFAVVGGVIAFVQKSPEANYALYHSRTYSESRPTSNNVRAALMKEGIARVGEHPLGTGPGTAGPASVRNTKQASLMPENYFLQISVEVGLQGLFLFLAIYVFVAYGLWQRRNQGIALVLLASLIGITLVNMVSHAWTDDTLSLMWWGLAGIALGVPRAHK